MDKQIATADLVIVVCTETYSGRFNGGDAASGGLSAKWEGAIITQDLYDAAHNNSKFIPIIFSPEDSKFRPKILRAATYYNVGTEDGYEDLYRRLTDQHATPKPAIGEVRKLPQRQVSPMQNQVSRGDASTPSSVQKTDATSDINESLVLLMNNQGRHVLIPSTRIESDATTTIHLTPITTQHTAFLSNLRDSSNSSIAIAFGLDGFTAKVVKVVQLLEKGKEAWVVTLKSEENSHDSGLMNFSMVGQPMILLNSGHGVFYSMSKRRKITPQRWIG